jgi:hypothetical protein
MYKKKLLTFRLEVLNYKQCSLLYYEPKIPMI